jgi:hypothetical protein
MEQVQRIGEKRVRRGSFEPLMYYKSLGYSVDNIEKLTPDCDKMEDPILGTPLPSPPALQRGLR